MTAALAEACDDIANVWFQALALLPQQDRGGGAAVTLPPKASRPPWNAAVANAVFNAHAGIRQLETAAREEVTRQPWRGRGGSDRNTLTAIQAIRDLDVNVDRAAHQIAAWVTAIDQLPARDLRERFIRVHGACCPYCEIPMLKLGTRSWRVTCLRHGVCVDGNGDHPRGFVTTTPAGEAFIAWADGYNQYAALTWENETQ